MSAPSPQSTTAVKKEERPPFSLRVGSRIELGPRRGTVDVLRGAGREPYEARIAWEGHKYPEWFLHATLKLHYESGRLRMM